MDILSKDVLTLLRDQGLREAVREVITTNEGSSTRTVTIQEANTSPSQSQQEPKQVTVTISRLSR